MGKWSLMAAEPEPLDAESDFRSYATHWIALAALVLITPFTLNNVAHVRLGLAVSSASIVAILVLNAWCSRGGRHGPRVTLLTLVPAMTVFLAMSISVQGTIGLLWCYPAVLALYCMLPERWAWGTNAALLATLLPIVARTIEPPLAMRGAATLLAVSLFAAILVRVITAQQTRLRERAVTDPLTGLLNRHALTPAIERAIARGVEEGVPMTLLVLDIDHFKRINDGHGHEAGDTVLRELGALLRCRLRAGDTAFRLGGEEFLVLLHGAPEREARRVADALREEIGASELLTGRTITASVGLATLGAGETRDRWMRRADSALYRAKRDGRDRVVVDSLDR